MTLFEQAQKKLEEEGWVLMEEQRYIDHETTISCRHVYRSPDYSLRAECCHNQSVKCRVSYYKWNGTTIVILAQIDAIEFLKHGSKLFLFEALV